MDSLHRRLERSRQMQTVLRAFEARDRNLLEDNLWRVSFWSCASVLVMLCVALTQVTQHQVGIKAMTAQINLISGWFTKKTETASCVLCSLNHFTNNGFVSVSNLRSTLCVNCLMISGGSAHKDKRQPRQEHTPS